MSVLCPRCQTAITCTTDAATCACTAVHLAEATQQFLRQTHYTSCLCNACLREIDALVRATQEEGVLPAPADCVADKHYYIDHGRYVFTAYYLALRGYCCQNGCRHCPYGYSG